MKTIQIQMILLAAVLAVTNANRARAQGTVTFDQPPIVNGIGYFPLAYFNGFSFRIGERTPPYDNMAQAGGGLAGHPSNGTPHLEFTGTLSIPQYVVFAWTDAASQGHTFTAGAPFGLVSVDLADPAAPSLTPIAITFNGYRPDNSVVSQTFTVGGSGLSTFQTFQFDADFASGLTRVEIPSMRWAMDNLVFVPEPGTYALLGLGLLIFALRRFKQRRNL